MSELRQIQDEILRRFRRPRTTVGDIPGYAGDTLGNQIDRESGDVNAPRADMQQAALNQSPDRMSGPRNVFAPPRPAQEPVQPAATRQRSVFAPPRPQPTDVVDSRNPADYPNNTPPPVSMDRARRTQPRDYVADDAQYLRELEDKPRTWKDKGVDVLRSLNQSLGSNPNVFTPTNREREILKAQGMLGRDIGIQKEQTAQQMAQMVPIYDASGNVIATAPRKTAASTQIRATDTTTRAGETKRRNDAYIADIERKDTLAADKQLSLDWAKGLFDDDPDMLAYVGKKKKMSGPAPQSNQGQLVTDKEGNFTIVRKGSATAQTVTDTETGKPKQSWVITKEQRIDDRARRSQAAAMDRALVMAQATGARLGNPEDLDAIANEAQANADQATAKAQELSGSTKPSDKKLAGEYLSEAGRHRAQAIKAREAASKARSGQSIVAPGSQAAPARNFDEKAFRAKFQEKYKRQPSEAEIAPYRNARP